MSAGDSSGPQPWISSSGEVAHPSSPRGGSGPGSSYVPKSLGADGNRSDVLPHPYSPSGRNVLNREAEQVLLAQNVLSGKKGRQTSAKVPPPRPVAFSDFNNKGPAKYVEAVKQNEMGAHPPGNFPLVNAVELVFKVDMTLAKKMGIKDYRCRQNVHSQELWERELKDGNVTPWSKIASAGVGPDDPDSLLQTIKPPIIAYHDAPGFMASAKDPQLKGPEQKMTSKTAVSVFLRQNFVGWIEGTRGSGKDKGWEQVSDTVEWHSNQSLVRDIFFSKSWMSVDGTEISKGHTQGPPK